VRSSSELALCDPPGTCFFWQCCCGDHRFFFRHGKASVLALQCVVIESDPERSPAPLPHTHLRSRHDNTRMASAKDSLQEISEGFMPEASKLFLVGT